MNAPKSTDTASTNNSFQWDWNLPRLFIRSCRAKGKKLKLADTTGMKLSGNDVLLKTFVLKRVLDREVLQKSGNGQEEKHIGVFLPPTCSAVMVNMALTLSRKVAVNLNYSVSEQIVNRCIEQADIKHVITSRRAEEKFGLKLNAKMIYLEIC